MNNYIAIHARQWVRRLWFAAICGADQIYTRNLIRSLGEILLLGFRLSMSLVPSDLDTVAHA